MFYLELLGVLPRFESSSKIRFYVARFLTNLLLYGQIFSLFAQIIKDKDLIKSADTVYVFITVMVYFFKLYNFYYKIDTYKVILRKIKHRIMNDYNEMYVEFLKDSAKSTQFIGNTYRWTCMLVVVFVGVIPFINNNPNKPLAVPSYYILDQKKYKRLVVFMQTISISSTCFTCTSLDLLILFFVKIAIVQFKILESDLMR